MGLFWIEADLEAVKQRAVDHRQVTTNPSIITRSGKQPEQVIRVRGVSAP